MSTSGLDLYTDVLDDPVELEIEDVSVVYLFYDDIIHYCLEHEIGE